MTYCAEILRTYLKPTTAASTSVARKQVYFIVHSWDPLLPTAMQ